jgi:hypothetical protein
MEEGMKLIAMFSERNATSTVMTGNRILQRLDADIPGRTVKKQEKRHYRPRPIGQQWRRVRHA